MFVYFGIQPKTSFAFSLLANSLGGSPGRFSAFSMGHFFPDTFSAAEIISFTDEPMPVPKLMQPE